MAKALLGLRAHLPRLAAPVRLRAGPPAPARPRHGRWPTTRLFRDRYAQLRLDLADHKSLYEVYRRPKLRRGETLGADVSLLKINQSELYQRITELGLEIAGENGGLLEPMGGNRDLHPSGAFIQSRPVTIYGGTSEIQRNIVAANVLGLR